MHSGSKHGANEKFAENSSVNQFYFSHVVFPMKLFSVFRFCVLRAFDYFKDNIALAFIPLNFWRIKVLFQLSTKAVFPANYGIV